MKILIIAPAWVGDMVMAQVLFKHLISHYGSETIIDVVAPRWSLPLLDRMVEVRKAIALDTKHGEFGWGIRKNLGVSLRGEKYDRSITMPTTWKSALVPFFARIPVRSGFLGEMRFGLINDIKKLPSKKPKMVEKYLALDEAGAEVQNPSLRVDLANQQRLIRELELDMSKPVIAFFAGAEYGEAKRWTHFDELAKLLADHTIWVFGSDKEKLLGDLIANDSTNVVNLCGKTTLTDAIDLIALAQKAVANDSGLMHVAAALGVPVVVIYGSSTPEYTPPLTDKKQIVSLNLECSPCFKRTCPLGHTDCLNKITAKEVHACV